MNEFLVVWVLALAHSVVMVMDVVGVYCSEKLDKEHTTLEWRQIMEDGVIAFYWFCCT
ncbi:hypothetical protein KC19_VG100400 [Ceratodon purpureus]|uniref:Uncharacterized protein n=1 Tax=Ceratodon purpureus TaxID=3225 RepID=A0A8T0HNK4_CERPU|nr:hypothetical protein KC19_VG100400 [Ceratodon purpureus]